VVPSGKSLFSPFHLNIVVSNTAYSIDGLDVSSIGLFDLRGRLAIIPQDPAMFEGTLRDNLDPRHVHDDTELWSVLGMFGAISASIPLTKSHAYNVIL
jgi:ABC-type multidrug transport system fused ATPase/permease subunit